jgi:hypothetical protein
MSTPTTRGRYAIHFNGQPCGHETFEITRTPAGEIAVGEQITTAPFPFPSRQQYRAATDIDGRVISLEVRWTVGERTVHAMHAADGGMWRATIDYQNHRREQEGDYPTRCQIAYGSHVLHTFMLRRLALAPGAEHEFAALLIGPPYMAVEPGHQHVRCTAEETRDGLHGPVKARRIEIFDPARGPTEAYAMWIDSHDIVLESYEGLQPTAPWMTLVEYARD